MLPFGEFLGNYRILASLSHDTASTLYSAEHTQRNTGPVFLTYYPIVLLKTQEQQDAFLNRVRSNSIQHDGQNVAIQDAGVANDHPYLVTAYSNEAQHVLKEHVNVMSQTLRSTVSAHPGDDTALIDAFLQTFPPAALVSESVPATPAPAVSAQEISLSPSHPPVDVSQEMAFPLAYESVNVPQQPASSPSADADEEKTIRLPRGGESSVPPSAPAPSVDVAEEKTVRVPNQDGSSLQPPTPAASPSGSSPHYPPFTPAPGGSSPQQGIAQSSQGASSPQYPTIAPNQGGSFPQQPTPPPYWGGSSPQYPTYPAPGPVPQSTPFPPSYQGGSSPHYQAPGPAPQPTPFPPAYQGGSSPQQPTPFPPSYQNVGTFQQNTTPPSVQPTPPPGGYQGRSSSPQNTIPDYSGILSRQKQKSSHKLNRVILALALLLLLGGLIWGGSLLYTVIPASSATVTITPVKKTFSQTYSLTVSANPTSVYEVQGRQISYTSPEQSQTVNATGQGTHPATSAKGTVVLSQIHLDDPTRTKLTYFSIAAYNGVTITTDQEVTMSEGGSVSIPAHADAGSVGNIPAHDIDGPVELYDALTKVTNGSGYISNPDPFTGGQDASNYTFVQQSDIDGAANAMNGQLTPDAKNQAQKQVHTDEHLVSDITCTPKVTSDHNANDEAGNVTVKVSVTCTGLAYTDQAMRDTTVKAYKSDGQSSFGSEYDVVGDVVTSKPTKSSDGTTFAVKADGVWAYQYTSDRQKALKNSIAGKKQSDALQVLQGRKEIQKVSLSTSGFFGNAVPTSLDDIKLAINKVTGLKA